MLSAELVSLGPHHATRYHEIFVWSEVQGVPSHNAANCKYPDEYLFFLMI